MHGLLSVIIFRAYVILSYRFADNYCVQEQRKRA